MKNRGKTLFSILFIIFAAPAFALAGSATLHWQPNTESDLAGYRIYYGTSSRSYGPYISVGKNVTSYTLKNLTNGKTYYFALTAVDTSGNESGYSEEVSKLIVSSKQGIGLPASGPYGYIIGEDESHVNKVKFHFPATSGNVAIQFEAWDVDYPGEVKMVLNGTILGYLPVTGNETWSSTITRILPARLIHRKTVNILKFSNTGNPPNKYTWGVRNVAIVDLADVCIPLPATGPYGMIQGEEESHPNKVIFCFEGRQGDVTLSYEAYDVDGSYEVKIVVNGYKLGFVKPTGNNQWAGFTLTIPDEYIIDSGMNIIKFRNTKNPPKQQQWGVRNLAIE